jgi:serine/threonine-protein kinase
MTETLLDGRYAILDKLGEGGVAVVHRARDTWLDRIVAIKILRQQYAGDPAFVERFHREAQASVRLNHPNIIAAYDVGMDGDQHYIVMEYAEGGDLQGFLAQNGPLPAAQALAIAEQACAALDHAHRQGFVHRDVKPHNIMLAGAAGSSQPPQVKIADFGLARSLSSIRTSADDVVFGTVQYISPEQARGEAATPASDIYALGVVLYEMLAGRLPFTSDTAVGLALKHIQEQPVPPSRINRRVPPAADALVLRALAKEPQGRFASAAEMGKALSSYRQFADAQTGRFEAVRPASAAPPAPRRRQGFDWLLLLLFIVTFIAIAGLVPLASAVREAVFPLAPTPVPQAPVPNIAGMERSAAESHLQQLGLVLAVQDERYDDKTPAQHIIAQMTPAGTLAPHGHVVEVIVSRGREQVVVPVVTGLAQAEAERRLTSLGLRVEKKDQPSTQAPGGTVIGQEPAAESRVERGSIVRLAVSVGDKVTVPNLFGKPEAEAQRLIREAGLSTTFVNAQGPEDVGEPNRWVFGVVAVGGVISQSPEPGALVERGAVVKLAVRKK